MKNIETGVRGEEAKHRQREGERKLGIEARELEGERERETDRETDNDTDGPVFHTEPWRVGNGSCRPGPVNTSNS